MAGTTTATPTTSDLLDAADDTLNTPEDQPGTVDVLANDSGPSTLAITGYEAPAHGYVYCDPNGSCTYYPGQDSNGTDSFTYTVGDGQGDTATATVNVTVSEVNDPPVAGNDAAEVPVGTTDVIIDVLANDSPGPDNESSQALAIAEVLPPQHGTATLIESGSDAGKVRYTPDAGYHGYDSFSYRVCDNGTTPGSSDALCATPAVNLQIRSRPPVAVDDTVTTAEDTTAQFNPLSNDSDPDGDTLSIGVTQAPSHGALGCFSDGTCTYIPDTDYAGPDSFSYEVRSGADESAAGTVTIEVTPVNDDPAPKPDRLVTPRDTAGHVNVLANDSDIEGDALAITGSTNGDHGQVVCDGQDSCTYTPDAGYSGTDDFKYTVSDGNGGTAQGSVTVVVTFAAQPSGVADSKGSDFWLAFPATTPAVLSCPSSSQVIRRRPEPWRFRACRSPPRSASRPGRSPPWYCPRKRC